LCFVFLHGFSGFYKDPWKLVDVNVNFNPGANKTDATIKVESSTRFSSMNSSGKVKPLWLKVSRHPAVMVIYRCLGTLIIIVLLTQVFHLFEPYLAVQYVALLYLLPVIFITRFFSLYAGILAAFLSFLAFNYYFIQPYNTFLVHKSQDLITLTIFLIVAIVISQLIDQSKKASQLAQEREHEATCMYKLISALAGLTDVADIGHVLAQQTLDTFHFDQVSVFIEAVHDEPSFSQLLPQNKTVPASPSLQLKLQTARIIEGNISLWFDQRFLNPVETRLLQAFCDQGALAIERTRLIKVENKTRVLEEGNRIKTSLLNSVSHELRSPLAAIKASVSSLRIGAVPWDSEARSELLTTVEEETDKLNLLVGNLLDMSRIEAGALNPQIKWNSISEIISSVTAKMRLILQDHPISLELPENLPLVPTDFVMMEQVFTNLISNSIKYAPAQTNIVITAEEQGDFLLLKVKNQSPSVPEEHLEHIFDKFHRITQADKVTGTGLGLSICKGIIEAHGGKIWAQNLPNGFSFFFTLPRKLNGALPDTPKDS
jgi:two-component system, OmpR family, sensor histidine kinase KdpD